MRSDESTHRFVNHSLANLKSNDINPFALREPDMTVKGKKIAYVYRGQKEIRGTKIRVIWGKVTRPHGMSIARLAAQCC